MNNSTKSLILLASTLTLAAGCDEAGQADDFGADTVFRCVGSDCSPPPIGNTSMIGDHSLTNLRQAFNTDAANYTADIRIVSATALYDETPFPVYRIAINQDGEMKLYLGQLFGWIGGEDVEGATFTLGVNPHDPQAATFAGSLRIQDAECEPGLYQNTMTICRYELVTDVEPKDDQLFPETAKGSGWYHVCPDDDERGTLDENYRFSSVFSPNVSLSFTEEDGPSIDVASDHFVNGCLNGAVSKGQYRLNAFYDANAPRGLDPSQRTAMIRMWMAWHDGESRTNPGNLISPHDALNGLFTWTTAAGYTIEGGYDEDGASCRGGSLTLGKHREIYNPVVNLPGWSALPHCDATDLDDYAVLGVKVPN